MESVSITLPDSLREFVLSQVSEGGYSSVSDYIRTLIGAEQKRRTQELLEAEIVRGLNSGASTPLTAEDWREIRREVGRRQAAREHG